MQENKLLVYYRYYKRKIHRRELELSMLKTTKILLVATLVATPAFAWITPEEVEADTNCTDTCSAKYNTICTAQGNFVFSKDKAHWATKQLKTKGTVTYTLKGSHE